MRTIETPGAAEACILDILSQRPMSAGNVTRKMMGVGLLPNNEQSYALVKTALTSLAARGLVDKSGNGKSVHWRLTGALRFTSEAAS